MAWQLTAALAGEAAMADLVALCDLASLVWL